MIEPVALYNIAEVSIHSTTDEEFQKELQGCITPHTFKWQQRYFSTIFGEKAMEVNEFYEEKPQEFLSLISMVITKEASTIIDTQLDPIQITYCEPENTHTLPLRDIHRKHLDKKINIQGIITTKSIIVPEKIGAYYECECGHKTLRRKEKGRELRPHIPCPKCQGSMVKTKEQITDVMTIHIEEDYENSKPEDRKGAIIHLTNHLCTPENDLLAQRGIIIRATGILKVKETPTKAYYYIEALGIQTLGTIYDNIKPTEQDKQALQELKTKHGSLSQYFAQKMFPTIEGYEQLREALIVACIGTINVSSGTTISRGKIHVALLGDPSTAKSQLLQNMHRIIIGSRYVVGGGASAVGLTGGVEQDEATGQWLLVPGEFTLANKSVLLLDEADKLGENATKPMHAIMEQLISPIAKASVRASLPADTTTIVALNPVGGVFDNFTTYFKQIGFSPALISRFDLIFIIKDTAEEKNEKAIWARIRRNRKENPEQPPLELFQKYLILAKEIIPDTPDEVAQMAEDFYIKKRMEKTEDGRPSITRRMAAALIRLIEAKSRAELRDRATNDDVQWAIRTYLESRAESIIDQVTGKMDFSTQEVGEGRGEHQLSEDITEIVLMAHPQTIYIDDLMKLLKTKERYGNLSMDTLRSKMKALQKQSREVGETEPFTYRYFK